MPDLMHRLGSRRGHFLMESGHHCDRWHDLDTPFAQHAALDAEIDALAASLRAHRVEAVCGPLFGGAFLAQRLAMTMAVDFAWTRPDGASPDGGLHRMRYRLPKALIPLLRGRRVALVDDAINAGSSLRATHAELKNQGANPVVLGALMVFGTRGMDHFAAAGMPVEAVSYVDSSSWTPADCPLCRSGVPLERPDDETS